MVLDFLRFLDSSHSLYSLLSKASSLKRSSISPKLWNDPPKDFLLLTVYERWNVESEFYMPYIGLTDYDFWKFDSLT